MKKDKISRLTVYTGPSEELKQHAVSRGLSLWEYWYQCGNASDNWNQGIELRTEAGLFAGWFCPCSFDDKQSVLSVCDKPYETTNPNAKKIYPL